MNRERKCEDREKLHTFHHLPVLSDSFLSLRFKLSLALLPGSSQH